MITMPSHALATEQRREAQVLRHLVLRDHVVPAFGLAYDEFADLSHHVSTQSSPIE